jgi:CheY-like chemotaxis protein
MTIEGTAKRVLVMEDTRLNYRFLSQILGRACPDVNATFVKSSTEALNAIQNIPFYKLDPLTDESRLKDERTTFDAAILDNQVPEDWNSNTPILDEGIRVAHAIRSMEKAGKIGRIQLYSYSADEDQSKFETPPFDQVLGKSISSRDLAALFNKRRSSEEKSSTPPQIIVKKEEGVQNSS